MLNKISVKKKDVAIVIVLLVITLVFRLWTIMMIHTGVDERDYWYSAKALTQNTEYQYLNHRTVRWSVIIPVAFGQLITGVHPNAYYLFPILNALLQTIILYILGKKMFNRRVGIFAVLLLIFFPYQIKAASQVRPEIFSITYILLMAWFFYDFLINKNRKVQIRNLLLSSSMLYLAYLAKITNLFFLPAIFILIFIYKRRQKTWILDSLIFGGLCLGLFIIETVLYGVIAGIPLGHLQIIMNNHIADMETISSFWDVFKRYATSNLQTYWQIPFIIFAVLVVYSLIKKRSERNYMFLIIPSLSFFFFITFTISGIHPLKMAEPFVNRYFSAVLPFVFMLISVYADKILSVLQSRKTILKKWLAYKPVMCLFLAGTVLFVVVFSLPIIPKQIKTYIHAPFAAEHPFNLNNEYYELLNTAWESGLPIIAKGEHAGYNACETASWDYIAVRNYINNAPPELKEIYPTENKEDFFYSLDGRKPTESDECVAVIRSPFRAVKLPVNMLPLLEGEKFPEQ